MKSAATTANNARRKRATVRSHVSFDHFHPRRPTRIRRYKGTKPSPSLSSRCFSAHSPFCIYVSLSICCSLFHDVFLGEHLRRERRFAPGRKPMEKVPTLETHMEESSTMTKFCHPADLCNLDQSCLDNLNDDLFVLFFCFF